MSMANNYNQYTIAPNLALSDQRGMRYPNQFFDLSQQYMPPTIKELFRWCTFYYYNSPLIGAALKKMSRYPITDLIIEDSHESVRNFWDHVFNRCLNLKVRLMEVSLDRHVYGNSFVSLHLPFTRMLKCPTCGHSAPIKNWNWKFGNNYKFMAKCKECGYDGEVEARDVKYKDVKKVRLVRWNPENIEIKHNEYTGESVYLYTVPRRLRQAIQAGDQDICASMPLIVIDAVREQKKIRMNLDNFIHLKEPSLAEQDQGWGKPAIIHVLKDMFYFYTLRRAQEAIAMEHIIPFDLIYPMPNGQQDPYMHTDLGDWKNKLKGVIEQHRRDPNFKAIIPIPVGFGRLGGDGKALLLGPEIQYITQTVVGGLGIPQEFLFGGLNWCIAKNSYIFSSSGMAKMGEICPDAVGFKVPDQDISVDTREGKQKIALVHTTEPKPQVTIRSKAGLKLTGSPIHKVWVLQPDMSMAWKNLEDLRVGDYAAVSRKSDLWGGGAPSLELCRLLGYLVSDGSVSDLCMTFANTDPDIVDDFSKCFEKVFGFAPKFVWRKPEDVPGHWGHKDCAWTRIDKRCVLEDLYAMDMKHYAETKVVPRIIRESRKECVFEFLKALFEGDGCCPVRTEKQSILYGSISDTLLEEVQLLLLNAGIVSHRYPRYDDMIPTLHIASVYAEEYMKQIGFVSERKNNAFNGLIARDGFRCDAQKYPYLLDNLKSLKKRTNGCGAWIKDAAPVLAQDFYTTREAAEALGRDPSRIIQLIKSGRIRAEKEQRSDGRYASYMIAKDALAEFVSSHGMSKRAAVGQTTWEINENNIDKVNWGGVQELDPQLHDRIKRVMDSGFIWDQVVEKTESMEKVEMCDLTVFETHSYIANGFVSHNTGSSVSLRTLENDFIQARTQLLELVVWIKDRLRAWLEAPDVNSLRFADFRMADDIQKNQQLIGLNAAGKVSDQTLLTELGYDYETEKRKQIEEAYLQNYITEILSKGQAKSQGESQLISYSFQQRLEQLAAQAKNEAQMKLQNAFAHDNTGQIEAMVTKLVQLPPPQAEAAIADLKMQVPEIASAIEQSYKTVLDAQKQQEMQAQVAQQEQEVAQQEMVMQAQSQALNAAALAPFQQQGQAQQKPAAQPKKKEGGTNMTPSPSKQPPRRQGGV